MLFLVLEKYKGACIGQRNWLVVIKLPLPPLGDSEKLRVVNKKVEHKCVGQRAFLVAEKGQNLLPWMIRYS